MWGWSIHLVQLPAARCLLPLLPLMPPVARCLLPAACCNILLLPLHQLGGAVAGASATITFPNSTHSAAMSFTIGH
jgi:hypothetical protein